jgi:hypothetical protein
VPAWIEDSMEGRDVPGEVGVVEDVAQTAVETVSKDSPSVWRSLPTDRASSSHACPRVIRHPMPLIPRRVVPSDVIRDSTA